MRFSGHESFTCRYAWLPKALQAVVQNPNVFANEDTAMVELGVGKNMVRSMRFWAEACGMLEQRAEELGHQPTVLGSRIFLNRGLDPFLEDVTTLWLMHWKLSTNPKPLLAWDFLLNRWQETEFTESRVLSALKKEVAALDRAASDVTLQQHLTIFTHSYLRPKAQKTGVVEDNLDCPLTELELIVKVGDREATDAGGGRRETIHAFRREDKHTISSGLFAYCLDDFWRRNYRESKTLSVRVVANAPGSPGQIFKIPEESIVERLMDIADTTGEAFRYNDSHALPQVQRDEFLAEKSALSGAYQ